MSADLGCAYPPAALLLRASRYTACRVFRIEGNGSLHRCADCGGTEAEHVVVALRERTCGTCEHADDEDAPGGHTFCTRYAGPFAHQLMPLPEGCTKWEAR